jgi:Flp pilus assembly secretin CpaC
MGITLRGVVGLVAMLAAAMLTPCARAQTVSRPVRGPYSVYYSSRALRPVFVSGPAFTTIRLQTTVTVPDGGSVTLGGYSELSEGRTEFGVPVLGRVPYGSRGFRNVGYGRTAVSRRVIASVRVIDLREEEFRQTGVRSR